MDTPITTTTQPTRKEYIRKYMNTRKNDEYFMLQKRLNNKLTYHRKKHNLNDDTKDYKEWKILYPELINITETLNNINMVITNNKKYEHIKSKLHELIDTIICSNSIEVDEPNEEPVY